MQINNKIFPNEHDTKKRAYLFALNIINYCKKLPTDVATQIIIKQLIRCATSVGANIVEAYAASSKKDFAKYYNIALKSANETKYWIMLLLHSKKANQEDTDILLVEAQEICKILAKSLITMRGEK